MLAKMDLSYRERRKVLLLFDVDGTLTFPRQDISPEMDLQLSNLKRDVYVGLVGGSDMNKIAQQTFSAAAFKGGDADPIQRCVRHYDFVFAENGLVAYKDGELLAEQNLVKHLGDDKLQRFINFCLGYMSKLTLPVKRGNFIEFRNGMLNICPVGRSCSQAERLQFNTYDKEHQIRKKFIEELERQFGPSSQDPLGLAFSIGGQISFDAFPKGWDKTFCLQFIDNSFEKIYFFGDKTDPGGNDYEIFTHQRTIGVKVTSPSDCSSKLDRLQASGFSSTSL